LVAKEFIDVVNVVVDDDDDDDDVDVVVVVGINTP
jgi:hypothetical protein